MFHERLDALCKEAGITITDFSVKMLGVSNSAASNWKKGTIPRSDVVIRAARYFNVSTDYLLGLDNVPRHQKSGLSKEETELLIELRAADPDVRELLLASLHAGLATASAQKRAAEQEKIINVPVLGLAAAGDPLFAANDSGDVIPVPVTKVNKKHPLFAVEIRGNSMEPQIPEGTYVIVDTDAKLNSGDLALVGVESNGSDPEYMVKEIRFHPDEIELYSYNEKEYPPIRRCPEKVLSARKVVYICPVA